MVVVQTSSPVLLLQDLYFFRSGVTVCPRRRCRCEGSTGTGRSTSATDGGDRSLYPPP